MGQLGSAIQLRHTVIDLVCLSTSGDSQVLMQRVDDELVRPAFNNGMDRPAVMEIFGVSHRATFYKQKRARAYDFPMDALSGLGGRPPTGVEQGDTGAASEVDGESQQQLDDVSADASDDAVSTASEGDASDGAVTVRGDGGSESSSDGDVVRTGIRDAIAALQEVESAL